MSLESALKFAKKTTEEKIGYRFQFPISMKNEFEIICEKNGVSMTDMILGLINSAIDEDKGITNISVINIINKIEELEKEHDSLNEIYQKTGDDVLTLSDGKILYITDDIEKTRFRINILNKELEKRNN